MTYRDTDPFLPKGTSIEDLRQYTEVLLGAAELAEAIMTQPARGCDRHYRISDPRIITLVGVPSAAYDIVGYGEPLESVTFHSVTHGADNHVHVSSAIGLEFANGEDITIDSPTGQPQLTSTTREEYPPVPITSQEVSDIIARLLHPGNDPAFSDFSAINDFERVEEICETLDNADFVTATKEEIYQFGDDYQIIAQSKNDRLIACEITEFRDEDPAPVSLTVEFNHFSTASKLYRSMADGSEELILEVSDLERFIDIINRIKQQFEADTSAPLE